MHAGTNLHLAEVVRCEHCGAPIHVTMDVPSVSCSSCGNPQAIALDVRRRLRDYAARVEGQRQLIVEHRHHAAAHKETSARAVRGRRLAAWHFLVAGVPLYGAAIVGSLGLLPPAVMGPLMLCAIGMGVVSAVVLIVVSNRRSSAAARHDNGPGELTVAAECPDCGAPNALEVGEAAKHCGHCGGSMIPGGELVTAALSVQQQAVRASSLARVRSERDMGVAVGGHHRAETGWLLLWLFPSFFLFVGTIGLAGQVLQGGEGTWLQVGALGMGAFLFLSTGALGLGRLRAKRERIGEALETVAFQLQGRSLREAGEAVKWMNRHWPEPYDRGRLAMMDANYGAMGAVAGYPTLVFLNAHHHRSPFVDVLVAAWFPGFSEGGARPPRTPGVKSLSQALNDEGFLVQLTPSGLKASAGKQATDPLREEPERAAHTITIVRKLARIAEGYGGAPPPPLT